MSSLLVAIVVLPFVVAVVTYVAPVAFSRILTVVSGVLTFGLSLALVPTTAAHTQVTSGGVLRADALSVVFLVATTFLYAATAIFAVRLPAPAGVRRRGEALRAALLRRAEPVLLVDGRGAARQRTGSALGGDRDHDGHLGAARRHRRHRRGDRGGVEVRAHRVARSRHRPARHDHHVLRRDHCLRFVLRPLLHEAPGRARTASRPDVVRLAFVLAVLGFGTKMGLVPVHTWLPDAHSEAPTPVSALLSGSLLAVSFYAILRYFQIAVRTLGPVFPRNVLLIFGLASLLLAALYLLSQRDLKRLLAYSSVEHMGILAIGMSFGAPIAIVGVLLHVLAHAAAKGTAFFGAGSVVRKFGTKDMTKIRGGIGALPWSGPDAGRAVLGSLGHAPVRHLPQRVPDRLGWAIRSARHGGRGARRPRDRWRSSGCRGSPPRPCSPRCRGDDGGSPVR